jgi:hypothetical protein
MKLFLFVITIFGLITFGMGLGNGVTDKMMQGHPTVGSVCGIFAGAAMFVVGLVYLIEQYAYDEDSDG